EDDRGVELLRRLLAGRARPLGAERAGEGLHLLVARTREREDAPALVARHLRHDVRGGAEAVEAKAFRVAREAKRPVADQPGAEERRGLDVRVSLRDREAEARVGDRVLGVAAVEVVAGEARSVAEVLPAAQAVAALAARPAEPRDADAPAGRLVDADDLVAGH